MGYQGEDKSECVKGWSEWVLGCECCEGCEVLKKECGQPCYHCHAPQAATHREEDVLEHGDDDEEEEEGDVRRERWFHGILNRREPVRVSTGCVH